MKELRLEPIWENFMHQFNNFVYDVIKKPQSMCTEQGPEQNLKQELKFKFVTLMRDHHYFPIKMTAQELEELLQGYMTYLEVKFYMMTGMNIKEVHEWPYMMRLYSAILCVEHEQHWPTANLKN
jgi:hypothetical protein